MRPQKYYVKDLTPQTRLSDLVTKKYHPQLKEMILELRRLTTLDDQTEWWRVRELHFLIPKTQQNYVPIAKFLWQIKHCNEQALKCSLNTFFYYLASSEHSNLKVKWQSLKTLTFSRMHYESENKKW